MTARQIRALFLDIGGVLLTNGWDRSMRARACASGGNRYRGLARAALTP